MLHHPRKWQVLWPIEHQDFAGTLLQGTEMLLSLPSHSFRYENPYSVAHSAGVQHITLPVATCQRWETLSIYGETEAAIKGKCQLSNVLKCLHEDVSGKWLYPQISSCQWKNRSCHRMEPLNFFFCLLKTLNGSVWLNSVQNRYQKSITVDLEHFAH